jgi:hypothetical protein
LIPFSCHLLASAEAERGVFSGLRVEFWVEVDRFDGGYDRDSRGMWVLFAKVTPLGSRIYDLVSPEAVHAGNGT